MGLADLPNEILQSILRELPPIDIPKLESTCRALLGCSSQSTWRHHCRVTYHYWDHRHNIAEKYKDPASADWRATLILRHHRDRQVSELLDSILSEQCGRLQKVQRIVELGYDAKDCLLRHMAVEDAAEDVLARRYYSCEVLGCLHRTIGVNEWSKLASGQDVTLERALMAFDLFGLQDAPGDLEETAQLLDTVAEAFTTRHVEFGSWTTRRKALAVAEYLRRHNLTGLASADDKGYHDLQNNFIGVALRAEKHPSMPLISAAIYCSVAQRVGIECGACGFPFNVIVIVKAPAGLSLDGQTLSSDVPADCMYLDPFASAQEVTHKSLLSRLRLLDGTEGNHQAFLQQSPTSELVMRTARNIMTSVQSPLRDDEAGHGLRRNRGNGSLTPNIEGAFYAALWVAILIESLHTDDGPVVASLRRRRFLDRLIEHLDHHFPFDLKLLHEHVVPLFEDLPEGQQLRQLIRVRRFADLQHRKPKRRELKTAAKVQYRVGQVFRHRRYDYLAAIIGWDERCSADEDWVRHMQVNELPGGTKQSFYNALADDGSLRYVAQENIELSQSAIPPQLMSLAGKYFKRWDAVHHAFISNVRDEYPDD